MTEMMDSQQLLAAYVRSGSEAAFKDLVARYINFVYSTALRLMDGDTQLAEDVTQTVFLDLIRHAGKLSGETMLGGWLHRDTCFVASKVRRNEMRRKNREREAVLMNAEVDHSTANLAKLKPILDEAVNSLNNEDRNVILLRFYEERDFRSIAAALDSNEDAVRMRLNRALDKLHGILSRQGVTLSTTALGTFLASGTIAAAPGGLATTITMTAFASVTSAGVTTLSMAKIFVGISLALAAICAVLLTQSKNEVRNLKNELREQRAKAVQPALELPPVTPSEMSRTERDTERELLKLRGEIGVLRKQLTEKQAAVQIQSQKDTERFPLNLEKMPGRDVVNIYCDISQRTALYGQSVPLTYFVSVKADAVTKQEVLWLLREALKEQGIILRDSGEKFVFVQHPLDRTKLPLLAIEKPEMDDPEMPMQMQNLPFQQFIQIYADLCGLTQVGETPFPANFITFQTRGSLTKSEVIAAMEAVVQLHRMKIEKGADKSFKVISINK